MNENFLKRNTDLLTLQELTKLISTLELRAQDQYDKAWNYGLLTFGLPNLFTAVRLKKKVKSLYKELHTRKGFQALPSSNESKTVSEENIIVCDPSELFCG
ncbi:hypothetical protein Zmor_011827 [Zophobas morio]|jgi:hypothetical protein|uniref:Uncharacterized protein n=1 Tax=Zophobas morio TaxID=2755281 RepID=A0AA38HP77_9CUCU|nr:hypothetical protein Zmor_011827 [Zophobas morio]